jgi:hypothetical protein
VRAFGRFIADANKRRFLGHLRLRLICGGRGELPIRNFIGMLGVVSLGG